MKETKRCSRCKIDKKRAEFHTHRVKQDGLCYMCKDCQRIQDAKYYQKNKHKVRDNKNRKVQHNQKKLLEYLSLHGCIDCGNEDKRILEFDHIRMDKTRNIGILVHQGYAWERVLEEIAKCEVVCPNCHRLRTYERVDSYRVQNITETGKDRAGLQTHVE